MARVYLLDNSYWTLPTASVRTCDDAVEWVLKSLGVQNVPVARPWFALFGSDNGVSLANELPGEASLSESYARQSKLVFMQRLFTPEASCAPDPTLVHLRYIQAVHDVMDGVLTCEVDVLIKLSAFRLQVTFGNDSAIHQRGFLSRRLLELLPEWALRLRNKPYDTPAYWETQMLKAHFEYTGLNPKKDYLNLCSPLALYGTRCFPVQTPNQFEQMGVRPLDRSSLIGVGPRGLSFLRRPRKNRNANRTPNPETTCFELSCLSSWGFVPSKTFWVEAHQPQDAMRFEYETDQGHVIAQLLVDYAAQLLKEEGHLDVSYEEVGGAEESNYDGTSSEDGDDVKNTTRSRAMKSQSTTKEISKTTRGEIREQEGEREEVDPNRHSNRRRSHLLRTASSQDYRVKSTATTKVQALYRGHLHRRQAEGAAVLLQSTWRGYEGRCRFDVMLDGMERELQMQASIESNALNQLPEAAEAATRVQSGYRGYCVRRDLLEIENELAAMEIQAIVRGHLSRKASN